MGLLGRRVLRLVAGKNSAGRKVVEEVLVDETGDPRVFRLAATPGLVLGVAAGDVLDVDVDAGTFEILSRGGNIAVQVFGPYGSVDAMVADISSLGGHMDDRSNGLTVFTVPVSAEFQSLEQILNAAVATCPQIEWYHGNTYSAEDGVTPLNWWTT